MTTIGPGPLAAFIPPSGGSATVHDLLAGTGISLTPSTGNLNDSDVTINATAATPTVAVAYTVTLEGQPTKSDATTIFLTLTTATYTSTRHTINTSSFDIAATRIDLFITFGGTPGTARVLLFASASMTMPTLILKSGIYRTTWGSGDANTSVITVGNTQQYGSADVPRALCPTYSAVAPRRLSIPTVRFQRVFGGTITFHDTEPWTLAIELIAIKVPS